MAKPMYFLLFLYDQFWYSALHILDAQYFFFFKLRKTLAAYCKITETVNYFVE